MDNGKYSNNVDNTIESNNNINYGSNNFENESYVNSYSEEMLIEYNNTREGYEANNMPTYEEIYNNNEEDELLDVELMPESSIKVKLTINFICNLIVFSILASLVTGMLFGRLEIENVILKYLIGFIVEAISAVTVYFAWKLAIAKLFNKRKIASYLVPRVSNYMISVAAIICFISMINFPMELEREMDKELDKMSFGLLTSDEKEEIKNKVMEKESGYIIFKIASYIVLSLAATVIAKKYLIENSVEVYE